MNPWIGDEVPRVEEVKRPLLMFLDSLGRKLEVVRLVKPRFVWKGLEVQRRRLEVGRKQKWE